MLIRLDCSVSSLQSLDVDLVREVVCELVRSYRKGHHLVVISRAAASWLLTVEGLSKIEYATIEKIRSEYTQNGNIHKHARQYINIICARTESMGRAHASIDVSVCSFMKSNIADRPRLLVENMLRDGWVYNFLLKNISDKLKCRYLSVDVVHGGGDDIVSVFEQIIKEKRIVCTIVDSDKNSPAASKNTKLSKLVTVVRRHGWLLSFAASPPCREVENLIPFSIISQIDSSKEIDTNSHLLKINEREKSIGIALSDRYLRYFDFKEGASARNLVSRSEADKAWIESKLHFIGVSGDKWSIPGYGSKVVDQIKGDDARIAEFRAAIRTNEWLETFEGFFENIIWLFFSTRPWLT